MIDLKDITKNYGGKTKVQALNGISLTINDGEIFGIIGKSGAGKSTLIRCININYFNSIPVLSNRVQRLNNSFTIKQTDLMTDRPK